MSEGILHSHYGRVEGDFRHTVSNECNIFQSFITIYIHSQTMTRCFRFFLQNTVDMSCVSVQLPSLEGDVDKEINRDGRTEGYPQDCCLGVECFNTLLFPYVNNRMMS